MFKISFVLIFCIQVFPFVCGSLEGSQKFEDSTKINQFSDADQQIDNLDKAEDQIAKQIYEIIEHFKNEDPVGLPMFPIPDPADVPDVAQSMSFGKLVLSKAKLHGISKFRLKYITTEIKDMEAKCGIQFDALMLKGNYSLSSLFARSQGPFTIVIKNVFVDGNASLAVQRDGKVRTENITIDIKFSDMTMDFKNLGFLASVFQSFANSASNMIFDNIKPFILGDAYKKMKFAIDENIDKLIGDYGQFPNSISPIDNAIAEARKSVRAKGFDPYRVDDYIPDNLGVFGVKVYNTWIYGVSSFYRLGDISLKVINHNAIVRMEIGTQELSGTTAWEVSIAKGMITRAGTVQFTVQHIKVAFEITQPLNLKKKLKIDDLQIDLGNIQIRCSGLGTFDYVIEFFVNVLPNLLRYQIMDALEKPLMRKIQEITDKIDVEDLLKLKLDEYRESGAVKMDFDFGF